VNRLLACENLREQNVFFKAFILIRRTVLSSVLVFFVFIPNEIKMNYRTLKEEK